MCRPLRTSGVEPAAHPGKPQLRCIEYDGHLKHWMRAELGICEACACFQSSTQKLGLVAGRTPDPHSQAPFGFDGRANADWRKTATGCAPPSPSRTCTGAVCAWPGSTPSRAASRKRCLRVEVEKRTGVRHRTAMTASLLLVPFISRVCAQLPYGSSRVGVERNTREM